MIIIGVRVEGYQKILALAKDAKKLDEDVKKIIRNTGMDALGDAKRYAPKDTGRLAAAIRMEIKDQGHTCQVGPYANKQAITMEYGRRPGSRQPPTAALMPWVRRHATKQMYGKTVHGFNVGKSGQVNYEANLRRTAYLVARAIKKHGIRGRRYMYRAFRENENKFKDRIRAAVRSALR